jgi:hypothetical protein
MSTVDESYELRFDSTDAVRLRGSAFPLPVPHGTAPIGPILDLPARRSTQRALILCHFGRISRWTYMNHIEYE